MFQPLPRLLLLIILAPAMNRGKAAGSYCTFPVKLITFFQNFSVCIESDIETDAKIVCEQSGVQLETQQSSQTSVHCKHMTVIASKLYH